MTYELHINQKCLAASNTLLIARLHTSYVIVDQEEIFNKNREGTILTKIQWIFYCKNVLEF